MKLKTPIPLALLALLSIAPTPSLATPIPPQTLTLTILHDNDLHGHLLSFAYTELGKDPHEKPIRGGAARRATLVRQLRASIHNPTLLIDSGDIATRGPLITMYEGVPDVEAMNAIGYDIAAIGNNEFKLRDGDDQNDAAGSQSDLLQIIKRSSFPWICANATDSRGSLLPGVEPYVVRQIDGVRIGFLGLTTSRAAKYPQTKGWTISDPIIAAKHWIPEARSHCDILIAVTHIGVKDDEKLAAQTEGLDAIIGGDSHTFLYTPVVVKNSAGLNVPIVQDGEFGADLGRFDLNITKDANGKWHIANYRDVLIPIGAAIPEAPDVHALLAPYIQPLRAVVGHIATIAPTPALRTLQTTQTLVDAMRQQTAADYALNRNEEGMFEVLRHTNVTRYDIYAALPFHDDIAVANLTGSELTALIAMHTDTVVSGDAKGIIAAKTYNVAFVDYEAGYAYKLPPSRLQSTGLDQRDAVIRYLNHEPPAYTISAPPVAP